MSLFKRHFGRRVTVVGVGVALLVLGLEAPAFAAPPTIASFTPTSGPDGCIVSVTGTAFTDSPAGATTLTFDGTVDVDAPTFAIVSATEIWVEVPVLVDGDSYNIKIDNNGGTATSSGTFLNTSGAGGCAATITSLTPACGLAGDTVKIEGTNLLTDVDPETTPTPVNFFNYGANTLATHTIPNSDTPTSLSVLVPSGAADGPIRVTTAVGNGFSDAAFAVPPPDCPDVVGEQHARSITLKLRSRPARLIARGKVSLVDATSPPECMASVPVKIQRRAAGKWRTVGKATTSDTGAYKKRIRKRAGKYRSVAPKVTLASGEVCLRDVSPVVRKRR